jgi:NADH-quinone oxidoreductase subunit A
MLMLGQYLPVVALAVLVVLFAAVSTVASRLLAPRAPHEAKAAPYECGIVPTRDAPERFPVRFFLVAMIFIVFDIELIFIYPWSTIFLGLGTYGLIAIGIFAFAVFESFLYRIGNGALEWGPLRRSEQSPLVSASRTSSSTVRRVGLEGRLNQPAPTEEDAA